MFENNRLHHSNIRNDCKKKNKIVVIKAGKDLYGESWWGER